MTPDNIRNIENIGFVLASISSILFSSKPYNILDAFSLQLRALIIASLLHIHLIIPPAVPFRTYRSYGNGC